MCLMFFPLLCYACRPMGIYTVKGIKWIYIAVKC